jgi:hypothetical protein
MYQTQVQLTSAAWIAFSTHSALLLLFAVILRLVAIGTVLKVPILVWLSPLAAYVAFARGNYNAVSERLDELRLLRGVVIAETALPLRQTEPAISRRSHLLLQYVIMAAYALLAMDVVYR